jgi:hypothetical protein
VICKDLLEGRAVRDQLKHVRNAHAAAPNARAAPALSRLDGDPIEERY